MGNHDILKETMIVNTNTHVTDMKTFVDNYLKRGFGSMNKNDFEVWIFNYLLENVFNGKKDYDISISLGIPITKVKRLRYEANLKYASHKKDDYEYSFRELLRNVKFTKDGTSVKLIIEDVALRKYLEYVLKGEGYISDGSFNTEIFSMSLEAFEFLLQHFWSDEEYKDFLDKAKKALGKDTPLINILKGLGKAAGSVAFREVLRRGFSFTFDNLSKIIEIYQSINL